MARLTKRVVDAAGPREKPYFVWCSELAGFGVRVFPSGRKVYYADFRTQAGDRRRMSLGAHGKLTVDQARDKAVITLADALRGEDPAQERAARRQALTIAELCDDYLAAVERGAVRTRLGRPKSASTIDTDRGRIEHHIKPLLGRKRVADLAPPDVAEFIAKVERGATAKDPKADALARGEEWRPTKAKSRTIVRGGPGTAARTTGLLSGILAYAVERGLRADNPVHGAKRPKDGKRTRFLSPDELRSLGAALDRMEEEGFNPVFAAAIRFCALTGCRLGEVQGLRWTEVNERSGLLELGQTKTGVSIRPLSRAALAVLPARPVAGEWVFPSATSESGHIVGGVDAFHKVAAAAGIVLQGVALHVFRHTFSTVAGEMGYVEVTRAAMLGQASHGTNAGYTHVDGVLLAAADRVAAEIWARMTGAGRAGEVVELKGRRKR